jgi:hypothetical protein
VRLRVGARAGLAASNSVAHRAIALNPSGHRGPSGDPAGFWRQAGGLGEQLRDKAAPGANRAKPARHLVISGKRKAAAFDVSELLGRLFFEERPSTG